MADFKTHASFGIALGIGCAAAATTYALVTDNMLLLLLFLGVMIGSFLPDLDSDSGAPFQLLMNVFSFLCGVFAFIYVNGRGGATLTMLIIVPVGTFFFFRIVVGEALKKFTHHRGIFHSIPAALIATLGTLVMIGNFDIDSLSKLLIAGGVGLGFLGHLVLDELKSATTLHGIMLRPSKSLGSALKLWSRSKPATITAYVLLGYLLHKTWPVIERYI